MGRPNKPWYRADRDIWVVKIGGKLVTLARGKSGRQDALKAFYALMLEGERGPVTVEKVVEFCLSWYRANGYERETLIAYQRFLGSFREHCGKRDASAVTPADVRGWVGLHPAWGGSSRHMAVRIVRRAFSLALKEKLIATSNFADMENPAPAANRDEEISDEDVSKMFEHIMSPRFRDIFEFIYETGCRPGEARALKASNLSIDGSLATLVKNKTNSAARVGRPRKIYMSEKARAIVSRLSAAHPTGPLFLNARGGPWTRVQLNRHLATVRRRAGLDDNMVAKAMRSHWITDALVRGVPVSTVAELVGHTSTRTIDRYYSKIRGRESHLAESVKAIRPNTATEQGDDHE